MNKLTHKVERIRLCCPLGTKVTHKVEHVRLCQSFMNQYIESAAAMPFIYHETIMSDFVGRYFLPVCLVT